MSRDSALSVEAITTAASWIQDAEVLLIAAGAGMGVDSGLPDFRGRAGLWQAYPPLAAQGLDFSAIANPRWFRDRPRLAWGFYGHRLALYRAATPHLGYRILHDWCASREHAVLTSNVDGQFATAGFDPARLVEIHGSIHHLQCSRPCSSEWWSAEAHQPAVDAGLHEQGDLPQCPHCGALARPNILMFNDPAWIAARTDQQEHWFETWLATIRNRRLTIVECGAGIDIPTVRVYAEWIASAHRGHLIRINPQHVEGGADALVLAAGACAALSAIDEVLLRMW